MSFFQVGKIENVVKVIGCCLVLLLVIACSTKQKKAAEAEMKDQQLSQQEKATQTSDQAISTERKISAVLIDQKNDLIEVLIKGNQKLVYTSIKQSFPFGIVIYLPETAIDDGLSTDMPEDGIISDLIVKYADKEQTTAKIEILLKEDLDYDVIEEAHSLRISLLESSPKDNSRVAAEPSVTKKPDTKKDEQVTLTKNATVLTGIEFNTLENGKSDIQIKTDQPIQYDITSGKDQIINLTLYKTKIPKHHKRPLMTQYFNSSVEQILPVDNTKSKNDAIIQIKLRDKVPYRVVQDQTNIALYFEASTVEPPVFEKAKKVAIKEGQEETVAAKDSEVVDKKENKPEVKAAKSEEKKEETLSKLEAERKEIEEEIFGPKKEYTGEKIKLDFYDTDIKNVFRILRSVGGLNFAIDKDVEGKVTLTLEQPVPWDQVMDLVLKMNNLGMKQEGNVVRIATLETLKAEQKEKQELIKAKYKSRAQKTALIPLVTEYLPINYADADGDIKPHIESILSGRGKISVDKRTNIIILTETPSVIEQAKEVIYSLDKVTPQIMIEAKVVEVSKDFARTLGIGWSLTNDESLQEDGVRDFNVSTNLGGISAVDVAFYRMFGSGKLGLNVQLAASETKGDLKIISSPKILTLDNKEAMIRQGLQYPYLERDDTGGATVKFKDIDLKLTVTPHVTFDQRISLKINLKKDDIDSFTAGVPSLSTNTAETELLLDDKDTVVIGGIVKNTINEGTSGMPWLSSIPGIGLFFRTDTKTDTVKELLIFLTPSIVQLQQRRTSLSSLD